MTARAGRAEGTLPASAPAVPFRIGAVDDAAEREADAVADRVLRRKCAACDEEKLSRSATGGTVAGDAAAAVGAVLTGPGQSLDAADAAMFGAELGPAAAAARIHDGPAADRAARSVGARAFALGHDVVFARGEYQPMTERGRRLLAHELAHVAQTGGILRRQVAPPDQESVWGFRVTRGMCGCRADLTDDIAFANQMRDAYRACDVPANTTPSAVETCVDTAVPGTTVAATTSPSGTVTIAPTGTTPCERIRRHATWVHEEFHARQADRYARRVGGAFYTEWRRLGRVPNRLTLLAASHPAGTAAFNALWNDSHEWVASEAESYTWERRFMVDVRAALGRICT